MEGLRLEVNVVKRRGDDQIPRLIRQDGEVAQILSRKRTCGSDSRSVPACPLSRPYWNCVDRLWGDAESIGEVGLGR